MKKRKSNVRSVRKQKVLNLRRSAHKPIPELKEIARRIHRNEIFTDRHCYSLDEVRMCFPIFGMMDDKTAKRCADILGKRGLIYEEYNKALPRGVNGLPMFMSVKLLTSLDHKIVHDYIVDFHKAEKAVMG